MGPALKCLPVPLAASRTAMAGVTAMTPVVITSIA
jgi:hypothetical protein